MDFKINKDIFDYQLEFVKISTRNIMQNFDLKRDGFGKIFRQSNPVINMKKLYSFEFEDYAVWNVDDYDINNYKLALSQVTRNRRPIPNKNINRDDGDILCFIKGLTTHDGIAIAESSYFMDESDVPPIDTWFYLTDKLAAFNNRAVLFSWIPSEFKGLVKNAIEMEMMGSYFWWSNEC